MFDPNVMPKRMTAQDGVDLVLGSAGNYYGEGVTQAEAEPSVGISLVEFHTGGELVLLVRSGEREHSVLYIKKDAVQNL